MGTAVPLRNIVGIAEHVFLVGIVPLQRCFNANVIPFQDEVKDGRVDGLLVAIEVLDERPNPTLVLEGIAALIAFVN